MSNKKISVIWISHTKSIYDDVSYISTENMLKQIKCESSNISVSLGESGQNIVHVLTCDKSDLKQNVKNMIGCDRVVTSDIFEIGRVVRTNIKCIYRLYGKKTPLEESPGTFEDNGIEYTQAVYVRICKLNYVLKQSSEKYIAQILS